MAKSPQNRKSYRYTGPVTPLAGDGNNRMLFPGTSYADLPEENPTVKNLIERKLLVAETGKDENQPADAPAEGA